jgi:hypothetical protein
VPRNQDAKLELLTFSECEQLVEEIKKKAVSAKIAFARAVESCTLRKEARRKGNTVIRWEAECTSQRKYNR